MMSRVAQAGMLLAACLFGVARSAEVSLPEKIDALIFAAAKGQTPNQASDDYEFLRRVYLDLGGRIPTLKETHSFISDKGPDKRNRLIDALLKAPGYARRMSGFIHVHFMERLGENPEWRSYLENSFKVNKPWDRMAREILRGKGEAEEVKGASFFYSKRLENYGQNPVDYSGLTRDVGRLFLGKDLRCAECHDHLFIQDYKQADFKGLLAFMQNTYLQDAKTLAVGEKLTSKKVEFMSVFKKVAKETGPKLPGQKEIVIPEFKKGEEFAIPPDPKKRTPGIPKFSPLEKLSEQLPVRENIDFSRNMVNRLWFMMLGRGLVHPLDLHHSENPPSHPELLDLLAREFASHNFDVKWLLGQLARTQTYQRSSQRPEGLAAVPQSSFLAGLEKRVSPEQLLASILVATGAWEKLPGKPGEEPELPEAPKAKFLKAFGNPPREPEDEISFSLQAALFLMNDESTLAFLNPEPGNLIDLVMKNSSPEAGIETLYLALWTRLPSKEEAAEVKAFLEKAKNTRGNGWTHLAWALLASSEFCLNH